MTTKTPEPKATKAKTKTKSSSPTRPVESANNTEPVSATKPAESIKSASPNPKSKKPLIIGICTAVFIIIAVAIVSVVISNNNAARRAAAAEEYKSKTAELSDAFVKLGEKLGAATSERDNGTGKPTDSEITEIFENCISKYGYDGKSVFNYYAYDDIANSTLSTSEIFKEIDKVKTNLQIFDEILNDDAKCLTAVDELLAKKLEEQKKKEAEEAAKAAEEAKKKAEEAERAERIAKYNLTYDKFTNQIYEGMTLDELKSVYTGFDNQCRITSSSANYEFYSCEISSSSYKTASFAFRYGRLSSKFQYGLD